MALPEILRTIHEDAEQEARRIGAAAHAEAEAILAGAHARVDDESEQLSREVQIQADLLDRHERARAESEAARRVRNARGEVANAVLARLTERLATFRESPSYPRVLRALFEEAREMLPDATVVRADPRDAALLESLVTPPLRLDATLRADGGVQLLTDDGRSVHNTLGARRLAADAQLRRAIGQALRRSGVVP
jgi:V/A-type H+/Na+-transporting ATPase subunit E